MLDSRPDKGLLTWVPIPLGTINFIKFFSLVFSVNTRCHYILEQGHSQGAWVALAPLLGKRSSKMDHLTPLILGIFLLFCIYLTLLSPKIFSLTSLGIILYHYFTSCPCIFKIFAGGFKGTNLVIPSLCIHGNTKYFTCI